MIKANQVGKTSFVAKSKNDTKNQTETLPILIIKENLATNCRFSTGGEGIGILGAHKGPKNGRVGPH